MLISIILPAYNEEDNILNTLNTLIYNFSSIDDEFEIIVVDDGSIDKTRYLANSLDITNIKVVGYDCNRGKGYALRYGVKYASGEYIIFLDSDMDIDSNNLLFYIYSYQKAEVIIASKKHPQSKIYAPYERKLFSNLFYLFTKLLTGVQVTDTQTGLKIFKGKSLRQIMPILSIDKFAFDVEILLLAQLFNMEIVEIPVTINLNSSFTFKGIFDMFIDVIRISLKYHNSTYQKYVYRTMQQEKLSACK